MRRIQLFLAALLIALGITAPASANNTTIALTAFVQGTVVETSPGVFEHTAVKVRITQKEIMAWLTELGYSVDDQTTLFYDGKFTLRRINGTMIVSQLVSLGEMSLFRSSPRIRSGIVDENGAGSEKTKQQMPVRFEVSVNPGMYLYLDGLASTTFTSEGGDFKAINKIVLIGVGEIDGNSCTFSGKMIVRDAWIPEEI